MSGSHATQDESRMIIFFWEIAAEFKDSEKYQYIVSTRSGKRLVFNVEDCEVYPNYVEVREK